jgi:hypothetical protein
MDIVVNQELPSDDIQYLKTLGVVLNNPIKTYKLKYPKEVPIEQVADDLIEMGLIQKHQRAEFIEAIKHNKDYFA